MNLWNHSSLKALVVPGGLLLLATALVLNLSFISISAPSVNLFYAAAFGSGLLLAWRFHSTRVFFMLLVLLLAERALTFYGMPAPAPAHMAFAAIAFLLPVNFAIFAFVQERGFTAPAIASRLFLVFIQSVFVALACRPDHVSGGSLLTTRFVDAGWFAWTRLPQPALLAFVVVLATLLVRFLIYRKPAESGSLWALMATGIALQLDGIGRNATAYIGTAGLMLGAAVVETSYFMAYHDELTSLPGRRAFNEALLGLEDRYAIAIVDVDHFKKFNDTYGHDTGDQVLRMVAARLEQVTGGGKSYRCGGEEFSIIFSGLSAKDAFEHLEAVRRLIQNSSFTVRGYVDRRKNSRGDDRRQTGGKPRKAKGRAGEEVSVTISIGVAEPGARNREVDQVIAAADKALYRAKQGGRNRVELDGPAGGQFRLSAKATD